MDRDSRKTIAPRDPGPPSVGFVDGDWLIEEDNAATRLGLRIVSKLHEEQSPYQKIEVYDSAFCGRLLVIDDIIMLTERDEFVYHEMMMHVPLAAHAWPRKVLIIGGGDGGCLREALKHESVERVVQCDIDERVTRGCAEHFPWVEKAIDDPRSELVFADGAAYVAEHAGEFDVIAIDSTDPVGPGKGLFEAPFYRSVGRALTNDGIVTAQTESPHWDGFLVAAIYRQLRQAFAFVTGYLCMTPSYPSGCWSLGFASNQDCAARPSDARRAASVAATCRYYNPEVHRAAFALPEFARRSIEDGDNMFAAFDDRSGEFVSKNVRKEPKE